MNDSHDHRPDMESEVHSVLGTPDHFIVVLKNGLIHEFNQRGNGPYWTEIYPVPNTEGHRLYSKKKEEEHEKMMGNLE